MNKQYLIENYGRVDITTEELVEKSGYTSGSIKTIASKLGLKRNVIFQEESDEIWISLSKLHLSNYYISNYGKVKNTLNQLLVSQPHHQSGYLQIRLVDDFGRKVSCLIHLLVAKSFLEEVDEKLQIDHIDKNRCNPALPNLRYVTPSENRKFQNSPSQKSRILNLSEVEDICQKLEDGLSISEIVKTNPIYTKSRVEKIKQRKTWTSISSRYNI